MGQPNLKRLAATLLQGMSAPLVDIDRIIRDHNIELVEEPCPDELSGMLVRDTDKTVMIVNSDHPAARRRFTKAHELGHFFLDEEQPVWVDRDLAVVQVSRISLRTAEAPPTDPTAERRANRFAAELLMPAPWVIEAFITQVQEEGGRAGEDEWVQRLAQTFGVSVQAMAIRLVELKLIAP